jgi:hypothetical protein
MDMDEYRSEEGVSGQVCAYFFDATQRACFVPVAALSQKSVTHFEGVW